MTGAAVRAARIVRWVSIAGIIVALFLLVRALPLETAVDRLSRWIDGLGLWGPVVFGGIYVVAALLFVPGLALTIAAGAVFGLVGGLITVSAASTTTAALAFLIGRYVARGRVEGLTRRHPRFHAVDRAIGDGGWRIIAMLRLVPLFPFSAGNYLLGLTKVRFWPYVLASWAFMLPGTLMYVYVGYLGMTSLEAASRADATVNLGRIALLVAGFLALAGAVFYISRLTRRRLEEATDMDDLDDGARGAADRGATDLPPSRLAATAALAAVALVLLGACVWANLEGERLAGLFGPPAVRAQEAFPKGQGTADFDHGDLDRLLARYVDDRGLVDYGGLFAERQALEDYIGSLAGAPFEALGRDEKLALAINAYNAFTLKLILEHYPIESIRRIPADQRWTDVRWKLGGKQWSLNQLEHQLIRRDFKEPRIHFALVCAAMGCPKLRNEAYAGQRLEQQLEEQARYTHSHDTWFRFEEGRGVVKLTRLYQWYAGDFEQAAGSVLEYVARYSAGVEKALRADRELGIEYLPYDWSLNAQKNGSKR